VQAGWVRCCGRPCSLLLACCRADTVRYSTVHTVPETRCPVQHTGQINGRPRISSGGPGLLPYLFAPALLGWFHESKWRLLLPQRGHLACLHRHLKSPTGRASGCPALPEEDGGGRGRGRGRGPFGANCRHRMPLSIWNAASHASLVMIRLPCGVLSALPSSQWVMVEQPPVGIPPPIGAGAHPVREPPLSSPGPDMLNPTTRSRSDR